MTEPFTARDERSWISSVVNLARQVSPEALLELRRELAALEPHEFLSHPSHLEPLRDSREAVPYMGWPRSRGTTVTGHRQT